MSCQLICPITNTIIDNPVSIFSHGKGKLSVVYNGNVTNVKVIFNQPFFYPALYITNGDSPCATALLVCTSCPFSLSPMLKCHNSHSGSLLYTTQQKSPQPNKLEHTHIPWCPLCLLWLQENCFELVLEEINCSLVLILVDFRKILSSQLKRKIIVHETFFQTSP